MKPLNKLLTVFILIILAWLVVMLMGCGRSDDQGTLPADSTIEITPDSVTFTNLSTDTPKDFVVVAKYQDGTPAPYTRFYIRGSFAEPRPNACYQFYFYPGGDLVPNFSVNSGFYAQADLFGTYTFSISVYLGATCTDEIFISSGSVTATSTIDVTIE